MSDLLCPMNTRKYTFYFCFLFALFGIFSHSLPNASAKSKRFKRVPKSRYVRVKVVNPQGESIVGAEILVLDATKNLPLAGQKYTIGKNGAKQFAVRVSPAVKFRVSAPGYNSVDQKVYFTRDYTITLRAPGSKLQSRATRARYPRISRQPVYVQPREIPKRSLMIVVEGKEGTRLRDAEVAILDAETKKILERTFLFEGLGNIEVRLDDATNLELVATAPGRRSATKRVGVESSYIFKLDPRVVVPIRRTRVVTLIVEDDQGVRLQRAEVAVVDTATQKIQERKLLVEGIGTLEIEEQENTQITLSVTAPGYDPRQEKLSSSNNYIFKLESQKSETNLRIQIKNIFGRRISKATVIATEDGEEVARKTSDDRGLAELQFTYKDSAKLLLEIHHGGYRTRKSPIRLPRDENIEVILQPAKRKSKSTFVTVVVLSKTFTASPKTYAKIRETISRILTDCQSSPNLWKNLGIVGLADGRVRQILPITKTLNDETVKRAKSRMSGLYGHGGSLSWRDLDSLAKFLNKSVGIGEAGCDVLLLSPKNLAMDETLSLYDSGGDEVMESFLAKNIRIRLVEIGLSSIRTLALKELCEGTQGFYKALPKGDSLANDIIALQFHFPTPPPPSSDGS